MNERTTRCLFLASARFCSLLLAVVATCNAAFRTTPTVRHWTTASSSPAIGCRIVRPYRIVQRTAVRATVPHAREETSGAVFGLPRDTFVPFALLLLAQFILFIGVGAVIPTLPLFAKESFGLSNAANGIVIGAPAIALLVLARPSGGFADEARKPAMMAGMGLIALSDLATALATELPVLVLARLGLGAGRCVSECGERGYVADLASRAPQYRGELAAALTGLVGAPIGGWLADRHGARSVAVGAATISALGLMAVPLALNKARVAGALEEGSQFDAGLVFSALILLWSLGVTALGPALTAIGQELAPKGSEATALALPRAVGDGAYILAPFLLGLVGDALPGVLGVECGVAGLVGLMGALALGRGLTET